MSEEQVNLINWQSLSSDEQAFVAAYISCGYSTRNTATELEIEHKLCVDMLNKKHVRAAVAEVQADLDNIEFLNERWVRSQIMRLLPKVLGEEAVPQVDKDGCEIMVRKFFPDVSLNVIKLVKDMGDVKDATKLLNKGKIIAIWDDGTGNEEETPAPGTPE